MKYFWFTLCLFLMTWKTNPNRLKNIQDNYTKIFSRLQIFQIWLISFHNLTMVLLKQITNNNFNINIIYLNSFLLFFCQNQNCKYHILYQDLLNLHDWFCRFFFHSQKPKCCLDIFQYWHLQSTKLWQQTDLTSQVCSGHVIIL